MVTFEAGYGDGWQFPAGVAAIALGALASADLCLRPCPRSYPRKPGLFTVGLKWRDHVLGGFRSPLYVAWRFHDFEAVALIENASLRNPALFLERDSRGEEEGE